MSRYLGGLVGGSKDFSNLRAHSDEQAGLDFPPARLRGGNGRKRPAATELSYGRI